MSRFVPAALACALFLFGGCKAEMSEQKLIAAKADQTTRQLLAGLNAKNTPVLASLIVVTNAAGGPPRPLSETEREQLVYPSPPYELVGAGKPGTMLLRDGAGKKRAVRLIVVGDQLKVLASREKLSAYTARETGAAMASGGVDAEVVSFVLPE